MADRNKLTVKIIVWVFGIALLGYTVPWTVLNLVPYRPYEVKEWRVVPNPVCAGAELEGHVTRRYLDNFDRFTLQESWLVVESTEYRRGQVIKQKEAPVPPEKLKPGPFSTIQSPLLDEAPDSPGVYRIRVTTEAHGTRMWLWPVVGEQTFLTDTVRVQEC